ncbi:MAG: glycerol-3-phosphate responsive antiterminator GlpP [Candidatus Reconcilbacillus cellulovorans]|uniref:Glycerol uptake operon antiterminator regulatory protein n=1 Tax=Candidatus Reconcilbacillus cellulovorans TaxID=1906605 RepID=A0A2A6DYN3_9BACL|nr:MAG: glycerol-3-phosphate responsive antiterminator GlpP [Candidatus Reconcilbacillus cellulovorans]
MNRLPIIASVTREEQIPLAAAGTVSRVNLMAGEIGRLASVVKRLHDAGKRVFVHLEMVAGLGRDASGIAYLAETFGVDGIVTTKSNAVVAAKQIGLPCIQRIFAIDTAALQTAFRMIKTADPDEVELMPGLMPRIIREAKSVVGRPLIVGGLIRRPEEIEAALASGADFVSIGHPSFWNL